MFSGSIPSTHKKSEIIYLRAPEITYLFICIYAGQERLVLIKETFEIVSFGCKQLLNHAYRGDDLL